jgi:NADP-dependent alcohol dehydrogenase
MYEIDHARTLAIIAPSLYKCWETKKKKAKLQYGKRIFNLEGNDEIANEAINKTVEFFHKMGMDTKLSDYTKEYDTQQIFVNRFDERGWKAGWKQNITLDKVKAIVEMSY